jgi:hypothetical protein
MLEEPILAAAGNFSTILLGDRAASEDWLLYDRLVWNSEKFIELFATTTRARSVGHRFTTHKKFFVDKDLLSQERSMSMDLSVWNTEKRQILSNCVAALRLERENSKSRRNPKPKKANSDPSTEPSKKDQQARGKGGSVKEDNILSHPATASVHVNEKSLVPHEEMPSETSPGDDTGRLADKNVPKENEITVADTENGAHTHDVASSSVNQTKTGEVAADDSAGQQCPTQSYNEGVSELLQGNDMGRRLG